MRGQGNFLVASKGMALASLCAIGLAAEYFSVVHVGRSMQEWDSWRSGSLTITAADVDVMVRTVIGEAADEPDVGKAAVAWVILNRARLNLPEYGGNNVADVALHNARVRRPGGLRRVWQFEPWMHQKIRGRLWALPKTSPQYKAVHAIVVKCVDGEIADPTNGATHFLNPDIVRVRTGGSLPSWARGTGQRIGTHVFFRSNNVARAAI